MKTFNPVPVDNLDLAFGGDMDKLLPPWKDIPDEFKQHSYDNKWIKLVSTWFFLGLKNVQYFPKEGINKDIAIRHIKAIMGSWAPKHEHKEAGCAYLFSLWFDDVKYEPNKSADDLIKPK